MRVGLFCLAVTSMLFLASCQKETGNNVSAINFKLQVQNAGTGIVQWSAGTANVTQVVVVNSQGQTLDSQVVNQDIDLFSSAALVVGSAKIPAGNYSSTSFDMALQPSATTPALHLQGTYSNGTSSVPVVLDITDAVVLKTVKDAISASGGSIYLADMSLDLGAMMQNITAADLAASDQSNGQLTINAGTNTALYTAILGNLPSAVTITVQ